MPSWKSTKIFVCLSMNVCTSSRARNASSAFGTAREADCGATDAGSFSLLSSNSPKGESVAAVGTVLVHVLSLFVASAMRRCGSGAEQSRPCIGDRELVHDGKDTGMQWRKSRSVFPSKHTLSCSGRKAEDTGDVASLVGLSCRLTCGEFCDQSGLDSTRSSLYSSRLESSLSGACCSSSEDGGATTARGIT